MKLFILLVLVSCNAHADILLDIMNGNTEYETTETEVYEEANGEHYSWELGINDSIPVTEVIVNPYADEPEVDEFYP